VPGGSGVVAGVGVAAGLAADSFLLSD